VQIKVFVVLVEKPEKKVRYSQIGCGSSSEIARSSEGRRYRKQPKTDAAGPLAIVP